MLSGSGFLVTDLNKISKERNTVRKKGLKSALRCWKEKEPSIDTVKRYTERFNQISRERTRSAVLIMLLAPRKGQVQSTVKMNTLVSAF